MRRSEVIEAGKRIERAEQGDLVAIIKTIEEGHAASFVWWPKITQQVCRLAWSGRDKNREALEQIANAFRRGLLRPKPGRRKKVSGDAAAFARTLQEAFNQCPIRMKRSYRNPAARKLDILDISRHVGSKLPQEVRGRVESIVAELLDAKPRTSKGFGSQVAAQLFLCDPRYIRSLMKSK